MTNSGTASKWQTLTALLANQWLYWILLDYTSGLVDPFGTRFDDRIISMLLDWCNKLRAINSFKNVILFILKIFDQFYKFDQTI